MAAIVLTAGMVAQATGGRLAAGDPARVFESVSSDSRTIGPGALFIALRGERFDGEAFVDAAIAAGAAGVLVSRPPPDPATAAVIVVPDTLAALQALGQNVRRQSGARVVAITGSAGKTTTKEMIAAVLARRYRVFRSQGNLNNHIGLPLSLLELRSRPEVAVVELGMNHAGEIRRLVEIAEPDIRVWTNVGDAHIGFFGSREAVASAKAEVLERADAGTMAVVNADDPLVMPHVDGFPGPVWTFGERVDATVRLSAIVDRGLDGTSAVGTTPAGGISITLSLPGRMQLWNAAAAIAVALALDVPRDAIESSLAGLAPVARRGSMIRLPDGVRVVDDSYNASPDAVREMIAALGRTPGAGRRLAVLGEMLELGDLSRALHEHCGRAVAAAGIDQLVVVGGVAADGLIAGARAGGMDAGRLHRFGDSAAAADAVPSLLERGDLVLVKGSRGTRTDRIVDRLVEGA